MLHTDDDSSILSGTTTFNELPKMNNTNGWRYKLCNDGTWNVSFYEEDAQGNGCGMCWFGFPSKDVARTFVNNMKQKFGCD